MRKPAIIRITGDENGLEIGGGQAFAVAHTGLARQKVEGIRMCRSDSRANTEPQWLKDAQKSVETDGDSPPLCVVHRDTGQPRNPRQFALAEPSVNPGLTYHRAQLLNVHIDRLDTTASDVNHH